ncbi:hypothetical protein [Azospirillum sp. sgz302134]
MFTPAFGRDDAALITPAVGLIGHTITAGGAADNVDKTAAVLDLRDGFGTTRFGSLTAVVMATATLAAGKTLTVSGVFEHSVDGVTFAPIGDPAVVLTLTGAAGGSTEIGVVVAGCNLAEAERFVRFRAKPDLSAANTDTAEIAVTYLLTSPTAI